MRYNFDERIDRRGTNCLKFDFARERGKPEGLLPLWIADMDFRIPPGVSDAIIATARHGIYGYTEVKEPYYRAISDWFARYFDYPVDRRWVMKTPGVVFALALAVRAFTERGDAVLLQKPVYYPFLEVIEDNGRELVSSSLALENGRYAIDFDDLEEKIVSKKIKLVLFCSPHNPVGRVWTREELLRVGEICQRHGCLVVSDEIHCDFVYPGRRHTVFSSISEAFADNCIVCTAPTKSFNLAGLQISNLIIPNRDIRRKMRAELTRTGYSQLNAVSLAAGQAAYETGADWLEQAKRYIFENLEYVRAFFRERLPRVGWIEPEGTYLVWLDFRNAGVPLAELDRFMAEKAGLWTDDGAIFGAEGLGFQRINIACPRATLERALGQLKAAFDGLE
jgi:cystathionine beta-lyase